MEGEEVGCCLCKDYSVSATSGVPGVARLLMYRSSEQSLYLWSLSLLFSDELLPAVLGCVPWLHERRGQRVVCTLQQLYSSWRVLTATTTKTQLVAVCGADVRPRVHQHTQGCSNKKCYLMLLDQVLSLSLATCHLVPVNMTRNVWVHSGSWMSTSFPLKVSHLPRLHLHDDCQRTSWSFKYSHFKSKIFHKSK